MLDEQIKAFALAAAPDAQALALREGALQRIGAVVAVQLFGSAATADAPDVVSPNPDPNPNPYSNPYPNPNPNPNPDPNPDPVPNPNPDPNPNPNPLTPTLNPNP